MSSYAFTGAQAEIVNGDAVRAIVGDATADRVRARFKRAPLDDDGLIEVDLDEDRRAVVNALREISTGTQDSADQQATESLLKALAGTD